ncbi:efflux RND transporter periplasmic adaptor subunit [Acinetobacter sp. WCHAc010034]|uniref:efflux RND transporter periplasmic adaptor subunit n=1 Tax=Acinetobacter sp. WCHAc010034 TaxID=1879049 RepID=UPI00083B8A24|nr:efflux RND transporter periplasmic adaptor subunit [Acinetobacter sp. WCHAc010034]AYA01663.1 efflux RND transporter periplasmic adaptor subunit [Acinetobacter sp. WCHAc010034]
MLKLQNTLKKHSGKISQPLMIVLAIGITLLAALGLLFAGKNKPESADEHGHGPAEGVEEHAEAGQEGEAGHEEGVALTAKQLAEQGIQLAKVEQGAVLSVNAYPAKLSVNTDQQAHVSPSFSGHVEAVYVELGQNVKKGQPLAALLVPELVDQQANLRIEQSNLELAKQDYERERQLWSQGISAKQDYQKAYNSYKQAQIQVQAAQSRLGAYGAAASTQGRYVLKAPISGVISKKDLVLGENVQLADQLFVIDQLDQLWLEFIVPNSEFSALAPNQEIEFKSLQTENVFKAVIQSLNTEADTQTGRLQIRAKVLSKASELRPNLMVNVMLQRKSEGQALRILKAAVQKVEGQDAVFIASAHGEKIEFTAQPVQLGQSAGDSPWIEVISGLKQGQQYAANGSFLLKSELEKGEASHAH